MLAESGNAPGDVSAETIVADASATQPTPVAPNVQLRDVTSIEAVLETTNPSPATGGASVDDLQEASAAAVSEVEPPAAEAVQAEPVAETSSPESAEEPIVEAAVKSAASDELPVDKTASAESADKSVDAFRGSAGGEAPDDMAAAAAENAAVAGEDNGIASTEPSSKRAISASDVVAQRFTAELIGESEPEPDTSSGSDPAEEAASPNTLVDEVDESARPKAVVGEPPAAEENPEQEVAADLRLLGSVVKPGTAARLGWSPGVAISGLDQPTPVLVVHGAKPGPTLCLTSAVHGDELNGIEVVRGVMYDLDPKDLSGTVIGVPIVNLQGFHRGSRYLVDRRDLNRFFPGYASGSMASRIAASLFNEIVLNCNMLVDIHTGSLRRANLPQLRADMRSDKVVEFTKGFDNMIVVHSPGSPGMMRSAAVERGIASVTLEIGESLRIQRDEIKAGIHSINSLLEKQDMYKRLLIWGEPRPVFYNSTWLRTDRGGILESHIQLGARVNKGDSLGVVIDPITNLGTDIISDIRGRVIGMAVDQVVMPGFATYHIGIESSERALGYQTEIQGRTKDAEPPTVEE